MAIGGGGFPRGGLCPGGGLPRWGCVCLGEGCLPRVVCIPACKGTDTPPLGRILDTRLWKHYLSATTVVDGSKSVAWQQMGILALKQFRFIYGTEWLMNPFVLKFCSLIQNHFGPNFSAGLNFVTCEHFLKFSTVSNSFSSSEKGDHSRWTKATAVKHLSLVKFTNNKKKEKESKVAFAQSDRT